MLQGESSIAAKVFHNLPQMCKDGWTNFWSHLQAHYGPHGVIYAKNNSQISHKSLDLGHPPSTGNGMMYCKEIHLLLLECFITFLRYIVMIGLASDSIYETPLIHTISFLPNTALKFQAKYQILRTIWAQEMEYCAARRYIYCFWSVS